jgi:hypothetical protein
MVRIIEPSSSYRAQDHTIVTMRQRKLEMYPLLDQEVRQLGSGYSSPNLGLSGAAFGAFISLLITDLTALPPEPTGSRFINATLICGIATLAFGVLAIREWWKSRQIIAQVRKETVDVGIVQGHPELK